MHIDSPDAQAMFDQIQADGMAIYAYLVGPVADYTYTGPDHEAVTVMVSGSVDGDIPGTVIPGTVNIDHGYPQATVIFPEGDTVRVHTARLAPYTPILIDPDDGTTRCAVCNP